jgi:hypothetical protein
MNKKLKLVRVSSKRKRLWLSILIVVGRASQCSEYIGGLHGWLHLTLAHPFHRSASIMLARARHVTSQARPNRNRLVVTLASAAACWCDTIPRQWIRSLFVSRIIHAVN